MTTLFSKILAGEIPADVVYEDEHAFAFRDTNPVAPTHVLVIPRREIVNVGTATQDEAELLGHLMLAAAKVAELEGLEDFRVVTNSGAGAGQSVFHLHLHVIGGRALSWPPG
jgi:histidine triad (HIT) family protein